MVSSQEIATEIVEHVRRNKAEIFPGFHKIAEIERIAYEMVGFFAQNELIVEQRDAVLTSVGAPRMIELYIYLGERSHSSLIGFFRIDVTGSKEVSKETCHNHFTEEQIKQEILLGLTRVLPWVKTFDKTVATAMLSTTEQETSIREIAQAFGPIGTRHSLRTGDRLEGFVDNSNPDLPVAYSEMTGRSINNLLTGVVHVYHEQWEIATVSGDEAEILEQFGWNIASEEKKL